MWVKVREDHNYLLPCLGARFLCVLFSCNHAKEKLIMMNQQTPIAHGPIEEVFPNIYMVTGINITHHEGQALQHSRNMIIYREENQLTLINTVKLTDAGLTELEKLGEITNLVRIGAFHGRDDAFYKNRYKAKLWALKEMQDENDAQVDFILEANTKMPFAHCAVLPFKTSSFPEAVLYIDEHDGILVTCDSVKNWTQADAFFSEQTASLYKKLGFFETASISDVWLGATKTKQSDFEAILALSFQHLLSAHGVALIDNAKTYLSVSVENAFTRKKDLYV